MRCPGCGAADREDRREVGIGSGECCEDAWHDQRPKKGSKAKREQRKRAKARAAKRIAELEAAIRVHQAAVEAAGTVTVADSASRRIAEAKHRADRELWAKVE